MKIIWFKTVEDNEDRKYRARFMVETPGEKHGKEFVAILDTDTLDDMDDVVSDWIDDKARRCGREPDFHDVEYLGARLVVEVEISGALRFRPLPEDAEPRQLGDAGFFLGKSYRMRVLEFKDGESKLRFYFGVMGGHLDGRRLVHEVERGTAAAHHLRSVLDPNSTKRNDQLVGTETQFEASRNIQHGRGP
ncbi:MAG: hypothetical protein GEU95_20505 [Rhizobiales bacterium]|nr:hypothetical protein [Hyphomicrobiales bacterium]